MSKFKDGKVFLIVDDEDISTEIVNYSTSTSKENMPSKDVSGVTKRIVETSEPVAAVYAAFVWYSVDEIMTVWDAL